MAEMTATQRWAKTTTLVAAQRDRRVKIERQLRLLTLEDENEEDDLISLVTNDPASLFWLAVAILSDKAPIDRVHIGAQEEDAEVKAGKAERGLAGFWLQRDRDAMADGGDTWNREMAFWSCMGVCYTTYWLDTNPDGTPKPIADVLSPLETIEEPGMDGYGPLKLCRTYTPTAGAARDHATAIGGTPDVITAQDELQVTVRDYWWREASGDADHPWNVYYCVMVQGGGTRQAIAYVLPPTLMPQYRRIPVLCGPVGGRPRRGFPSAVVGARGNERSLLEGQGVLDQNEPIYKFINKIITGYARVARQHQRGLFVAAGFGMNVTEEDINLDEKSGVESKIIHTTNPQASLSRVQPGQSPVEIRDLIDIADRLAERGGLSRALYGAVESSVSGFAISRILSSAGHKLTPYANKMNFAREMVGEGWLTQYRDGKFKPYLVQSVNRGMMSGQAEEFRPDDVPDRFFVRSDQPLALPSDWAERINTARMARPQGPVMSFRGMQENLLAGIVEDPALDREWLADDLVDAHPMVQAGKIIARLRIREVALREQGKAQAADLVGQMAKLMFDNLGTQLGVPAAPAPKVGVTNSTLPNEMQQAGQSEDVIRAFLGQAQGNVPNEVA